MSTATKKAAESLEGKQCASYQIASKGINTSKDFANLMCGLMSDVISGNMTPAVANAAVNAGGKLLKVVELENKYGTHGALGGKSLQLSAPSA